MIKVENIRILSDYEFLKHWKENENALFDFMISEVANGMMQRGVIEKRKELMASNNIRLSLSVYAMPEGEFEALIEAFDALKKNHPESYEHAKAILDILNKN
jgi:hypothetical protein